MNQYEILYSEINFTFVTQTKTIICLYFQQQKSV